MQKQRVSITLGSFIRLFLVIISFLAIYVLRDIIGLFFVAVIFAAAIIPIVDKLQKKLHLPRSVAILLIYFVMFLVISLIVGFLVPPIYSQVNDIAKRFPTYYDQISGGLATIQGGSTEFDFGKNLKELAGKFSGLAGSGLLAALSSLFGGVVFFVIVLVVIVYIVVEDKAIEKIVDAVVPNKYVDDVSCLLYRIQAKLGHWLRNVLLLGVIIAVMTFVFMVPVMPKYALVLALFAGLTEFIPYVGPFLGAVPAVFLAFGLGSWPIVIYVIIAYIIIQQAENHLIVPQVMKRAVGLHPVLSIIAVMVGARLGTFLDIGPVVGVLLAIPIATTILEIVNFYVEKRKALKECRVLPKK